MSLEPRIWYTASLSCQGMIRPCPHLRGSENASGGRAQLSSEAAMAQSLVRVELQRQLLVRPFDLHGKHGQPVRCVILTTSHSDTLTKWIASSNRPDQCKVSPVSSKACFFQPVLLQLALTGDARCATPAAHTVDHMQAIEESTNCLGPSDGPRRKGGGVELVCKLYAGKSDFAQRLQSLLSCLIQDVHRCNMNCSDVMPQARSGLGDDLTSSGSALLLSPSSLAWSGGLRRCVSVLYSRCRLAASDRSL